MFSYLHGIRPSNRRSAIPPSAAPPQASSSRYYHETVESHPQSVPDPRMPPSGHSQVTFLDDASPVSPDPPILPPIPRVASQHEKQSSSERNNQAYEGNSELLNTRHALPQQLPAEAPFPAPNDASRIPKPRTDGTTTKVLREAPEPDTISQELQSTASRRKRPIDLAYESMRSYTEPPTRQSFGSHAFTAPFHQPPSRQPPPPPPTVKISKNEPLPPPQSQAKYRPQPTREAPPPPITARPHAPSTANPRNVGKAKLNLLNPMSLLARRRSSQAVEEAYTQSQGLPGTQLPDPRIRGKVVHDFSAPRPGRPLSSEAMIDATYDKDRLGRFTAKNRKPSPSRDLGEEHQDDSAGSGERGHTPIFKENFDDHTESWSSEMDSPAKRKSSALIYQVALQSSQAPEPSSLPAFARNLPSSVSNDVDTARKTSTPPKAPLEAVLEPPLPNQTPSKSLSSSTPPKSRSPAASVSDPSLQGLGSPQRYKSNASRFSFDLAGVGSAAQEKILEDKHRLKAKQKERAIVLSIDTGVDDDDDPYVDYDDMDDDGLEERIPGINADAEDNDFPSLQNPDSFGLISPNKSSFESVASRASTSLTSPATPRDSGQIGALTGSKSSPSLPYLQSDDRLDAKEIDPPRPRSNPGSSSETGLQGQPFPSKPTNETELAGLPPRRDIPDVDDMYYDDGMIEDFETEEHQGFDESVFDDDTSGVYGLTLQDQGFDSRGNILAPQASIVHGSAVNAPEPSGDEDVASEMRDSIADLNPPVTAPTSSNLVGLTQDNLGLHDRLAFAANQAALEGKFKRTHSQGSTHESYDDLSSSRGTAVQKQQMPFSIDEVALSQDRDDLNDFAFDDSEAAFTSAEDDDPIIAAANAEALENDDDGFYGQEFGFFARKPGSGSSGDAEYANGGYFGPRAIESIHRMNSGRDNFQEPSLTPITERSEWSNRNSTISLAMHGFPLSAQYQSNPQLADLMRVQEGEELSLDALKKLRRGAWGSSEVSLQSSSNSGLAAPLMMHSNSNNSLLSPSSQNLAGSFHSFSSNGHNSSNDSISSPSADSPTVTLATLPQHGLTMPTPMPMGPPPPPPVNVSPTKRSSMSGKPWAPGHSRNSSGAESVSYREENGRWYCEKTRVIEETGEVEVLGRTVVEGGRI